MDKIVFGKDLMLGVETIDRQHARLVELINSLIEMKTFKSSRQETGEVLDELASYIFEHFRDEEKMMLEVGYPDLEAHRDLHADFVRQVMSFNKQFRSGDKELDNQMLTFLSLWLVEHIKGEDPRYVKLFKAHGY